MRFPLLLAAPLLFSGCVVVDAPETIEELVVFGFQNHTEGEQWREAFAEGLFPLVDDIWVDLNDEGYKVDNLNSDHLEAVGVENANTETIIGALGAAEYTHGIDDVLWAITYPDKSEVFENFVEYDVVEQGDRDCFLARECESYTQHIDQTVEVLLVQTARTVMFKDHRWVEIDGMDPFVIGRTLVPDPVELGNPIIDVHQQYDIFLIFPRDGAAARIETVWIDATFGDVELPDYFLVDQAVNGMGNQAERIDELIDAER